LDGYGKKRSDAMRTDVFNENLRDLVNRPEYMKATPGESLAALASDFYGKQAMEKAKALGEETQSEIKTETRAQKGELAEAAMGSRETMHEAGMEAKGKRHLANLAFSRDKAARETALYDEQLALGKKQAERATLFAGLGAAIKLGDAAMVKTRTDDIVAKWIGYQGKIDDLKSTMKSLMDNWLTVTKKRREQFKGAALENAEE
jgi:hypothetical protein